MTTTVGSLRQAYDFVNTRYVFNEINYPSLKSLTGDDRLKFQIIHSLLHLQKNIANLTRQEHNSRDVIGISIGKDSGYQSTATKNLINFLKIADVIIADREAFLALTPIDFDPYYSQACLGTLIQDMMVEIATIMETYDHGKRLSKIKLVDIVTDTWRKILSNKNLFVNDPEGSNKWDSIEFLYPLVPQNMFKG